MRTEELIQKLAAESRPVKPLPHPMVRLAVWVVLSVTALVFGIELLGTRPALASLASQINPQVVLTLVLGVSAAAVVLVYSVPGRKHRRLLLIPWASLAVWTLLIVYDTAMAADTHTGHGINCIRNIAILSVLPGFLLYVSLRTAAPLKARLTGFLAALGVGACSCGATRFICSQSSPAHFLMWHFLPVLLLAAAGFLAGPWIFRRRA